MNREKLVNDKEFYDFQAAKCQEQLDQLDKASIENTPMPEYHPDLISEDGLEDWVDTEKRVLDAIERVSLTWNLTTTICYGQLVKAIKKLKL